MAADVEREWEREVAEERERTEVFAVAAVAASARRNQVEVVD
jgi:hypothetical protein